MRIAAAAAGDVAALRAIDRRVLARKLSSEARTMSTRMGSNFAELAAQVDGPAAARRVAAAIDGGTTPGCIRSRWPSASRAQGLSAREAFVVHQYGVGATILSAALRLMRIGHHETQAMLFALNAGVEDAYAQARGRGPRRHGGLRAAHRHPRRRHVQAHVRLFMN